MEPPASNAGLLRVIHQNIRGLNSKCYAIDILVEQFSPDIMCLTEHFLSGAELSAFHVLGYDMATGFCRSRLRRGGVCILVSDVLKYKPVDVGAFCAEGVCELAAVMVEIGCHCYFFLSLYRPPTKDSSKVQLFFELLGRCLDSCLNKNTQSVICGDFNIDLSVNSRHSGELRNLMSSYGLRDTILTYTREYGGSSSLIDNIFTNVHLDRFKSSNLLTGISDHHGQVGDISIDPHKTVQPVFKLSRSFSQDSMHVFSFLLGKESWNDLLRSNEVDGKFESFMAIVRYYFEIAFPEKKTKVRDRVSSGKVVFPPYLLKMREEVFHMYSLSRDLGSSHPIKCAYLNLKRKFREEVRSCRASQVRDRITKSSNVQKTSWEIVNELIPGKAPKPFTRLTIRSAKGDVLDDPEQVSDYLNDYFIHVGQSVGGGGSSAHDPCLGFQSLDRCLYLFPTDRGEVLSAIKSLKSSNSSGRDGISSRVLKACATAISAPLASIINASFEGGKFPSQLKSAMVKPLPKVKNADDPKLFRPISILSTFSKVVEKIFLNRLSSFIETNSLLFDKQFGFKKNTSTVDALFHFVSHLTSSLDRKMHAMGIFLDLSKAFDVVNHSILLEKLDFLGFKGKAYDWISSYLLNRSQLVSVPYIDNFGVLRGKESKELLMQSGVPQGSVLGPILFLLFVNDISKSVSRANLCLFADDTSLSLASKCLEQLEMEAFIEVSSVLQWLEVNKLCVNEEKTRVVNFSLGCRSGLDVGRRMFLGDFEISSTSTTNFLGVIIDSGLNFHEHIDEVLKRLNRVLYLLRRLSYFSDRDILLLAYYGCFFPILSYGVSIWGYDNSKTGLVFKAQKRAVRIVFGLGSATSCRGIFRENRLLTFTSIYILNSLVFLKKNKSIFLTRPPSRYDLRGSGNLTIPRHKTTFLEHQSYYASIKMYNNLPCSLKEEADVLVFKRRLKDILIVNEFYSLKEFFGHKF